MILHAKINAFLLSPIENVCNIMAAAVYASPEPQTLTALK